MKRHHKVKASVAAAGLAGAIIWATHGKHPVQPVSGLKIPESALIYSDTSNALLGISGPKGVLLDKEFFCINYNPAWGSAYWVAECLQPSDLKGKASRKGMPFYADPELPESLAVTPKDYTGSGFDRGHLAPAGDMVRSKEAMFACFTMANMHAQTPDLNRRAWRLLEEAVRDSVKTKARTWIVTGQIFAQQFVKWIQSKHRVVVPDRSFKAVLMLDEAGNYTAFGALGENVKEGAAVTYVAVDSLEALSGFDFFPLLPDSIEDAVEVE